MSYSMVMQRIWYVVEAVNNLREFDIEYPESTEKQDEIARDFQRASMAKIPNCTDAINGILIWIKKPALKEANRAKCSQMKFLCGQKGKFC